MRPATSEWHVREQRQVVQRPELAICLGSVTLNKAQPTASGVRTILVAINNIVLTLK